LYFIRACFFVLIFVHFVFTYNTNIHASGGIRTRNRRKRMSTDPRLRQLGHWDRLFDPRTVYSAASCHTDWSIPTQCICVTLKICLMPWFLKPFLLILLIILKNKGGIPDVNGVEW
jgi:hypothetical protein